MRVTTFVILMFLAFTVSVIAQDFPAINPDAPIPPNIEKKIQTVTNIVLAVIGALVTIATAGSIAWVYIAGKIREAKNIALLQSAELKERQDRLSRKNSELQAQVTQTALVTPAAPVVLPALPTHPITTPPPSP